MAFRTDSQAAKPCTAESASSWGTNRPKSGTDMMATSGESWHSAGSLGSWGGAAAARLRDAIFAKTDLFNPSSVTDQMLLQCFMELDRRGDGVVRPKQLYKAFRKCGLRVSKSALCHIMKDLGADPEEGINSVDFIDFFRSAEELTLEDTHPKKHCSIWGCIGLMFIFLGILSTFLVLMYYTTAWTDEWKGYSIGAFVAGGVLMLLVCISLITPTFYGTIKPAIAPFFSKGGTFALPEKEVTQPAPNWSILDKGRVRSKKERSLKVFVKPCAQSYVTAEHREDAGDLTIANQLATISHSTLSGNPKPATVVHCQAADRAKKLAAIKETTQYDVVEDCRDQFRRGTEKKTDNLNAKESYEKKRRAIPLDSRPYDLFAYKEAASLAQSRPSPTSSRIVSRDMAPNVTMSALVKSKHSELVNLEMHNSQMALPIGKKANGDIGALPARPARPPLPQSYMSPKATRCDSEDGSHGSWHGSAHGSWHGSSQGI